LHGNLFENMVVVEALKARLNAGKEPRLYFWQDSNHNEVDLIYEKQRRLVPIEIKSAMTWHRDFAANISKFQRSVADAEDGYVIYAGDLFPSGSGFTALGHASTSTIFS
jgi:predicted AAA+ superfamily ATPase